MTIDTTNMQPDDLVRRWPAECAIDFDDYDEALPEGSCIAIGAVCLLSLLAVVSLIAAIY